MKQTTKESKRHRFYLVSDNTEYPQICISAGPDTKAAIQKEMRKRIPERLIELELAANDRHAEQIVKSAEINAGIDDTGCLWMRDDTVTIFFGNNQKECWQIAEYPDSPHIVELYDIRIEIKDDANGLQAALAGSRDAEDTLSRLSDYLKTRKVQP